MPVTDQLVAANRHWQYVTMDDHKTIDLTLIPKSLTLKRAASYPNLYTTLLAASLLGSLIPSSASARTFRVVTLADAPAPPLTVAECGDLPEPTCTSTLPSAECTLRAAVQWANNCPGHDTIQLDAPGGGTYSLDRKSTRLNSSTQ